MMFTLLLISIAGGTGAFLRYTIGEILAKRFNWPRYFTVITFVNIIGSTCLGIAVGSSLNEMLEFFIIYFLGGFTTFSTFSVEALQCFKDGHAWRGLLYIALTVTGSVVGFWLGIHLIL
ncbi:CrcB family protein [Shouchella sp. 1P09AA]|uniref:fluoride efflux transporter FluC n=1 Tax=unclassified Shouchella TaxID=2893065 RepID=UPI0039A2D971